MNEKQICIETRIGTLIAKVHEDTEYPGITLFIRPKEYEGDDQEIKQLAVFEVAKGTPSDDSIRRKMN